MKNSIIGFLVLLFFPLAVLSQVFPQSASLTGGIYGDGYGGEATYVNYLGENSFTQIALNGTYINFQSGETTIPYYSVAASYSYFLTVLSRDRKMQALSIGGGLLGGYESANNGMVEISNIVSLDGKSKLIYGPVLSADLDIIISDYYSIVLKTSQAYHVNSDFGKWTNYSGIGLRYYFN